MSEAPEVSVIIPVYNEANVIGDVMARTHQVMADYGRSYELVIINDGSTDATAFRAGQAGGRVISHPYNIGNGAAIKTGIRGAYGRVLVMLDGDGQHAPEDIPRLLEGLASFDMVVGARNIKGGASLTRNLANAFYNILATYVCSRKIQDLTSGFRAIRGRVARALVPLLPNSFSYPTTLTLALVRSGFSLAYLPITALPRQGKSKIKPLTDGLRFLLIIFKISTLYSPLKIFLPVSTLMFATGFGYGLIKVLLWGERYGPTSAMLMTIAILIFMIGLVSEQISQLRFDKADIIRED